MLPNEVLQNPLLFKEVCWPDIKFYDKQVEIIQSVIKNDCTLVPAGNQLGKDFISAFIVLWFFCSRSPCKVVTSSADYSQLKNVLWGEIHRFISTSEIPLPIIVNEMELYQRNSKGDRLQHCYVTAKVPKKGEGVLGHHLERGPGGYPRTLFVADEASGAEDEAREKALTWAHRDLSIGNCFTCNNYFFRETEEGDLPSGWKDHHYRKVIRITAEDSPNVRLARAEISKGKEPSNKILIPGILDYQTYQKRRETWDVVRQTISLDAQFYKGAQVLLFPPDWLDRAERIAEAAAKKRKGLRTAQQPKRALGIDSAEGNDNSSWCEVDEWGMLSLESEKTENTTLIPEKTILIGEKAKIPPERWLFDRGGGGKQHADLLRKLGYHVQTIGFGEAVSDPNQHEKLTTFKSVQERLEQKEDKYIYKNRRAELYGGLRNLLDPLLNPQGFGLPAEILNRKRVDGGPSLRDQLAVIPLLYDDEGRLYLPPKRTDSKTKESLSDILGCSPDEADALVLAVFGLTFKPKFVIRGLL